MPRRIRQRKILCVLILSNWNVGVNSFVPSSRSTYAFRTCGHSCGSSVRLRQHEVEEKLSKTIDDSALSEIIGSDKEGKIVRMIFSGSKSVTTAPVTVPKDDVQVLNDFFAVAENRNLLFFKNHVRVVKNPPAHLIERWAEEVSTHGGIDLFEGGRDSGEKNVLEMKAYLKMPGLNILSETLVGANLIYGIRKDSSYPEYQFVVLDTKLKPEGAAPLVWLFKKLEKYTEKVSSFSRVRPVAVNGAKSSKIVFVTDAKLQTRIQLPSTMARILPVDLTKFEQQGSKSMQKLLEKELEPALICFREAFVEWVK